MNASSTRQPAATKKQVVVTGDVVVDHHIYEGERNVASTKGRGVKVVREHGGAKVPFRIIEAIIHASPKSRAALNFGLSGLPGREARADQP